MVLRHHKALHSICQGHYALQLGLGSFMVSSHAHYLSILFKYIFALSVLQKKEF